MQALLPVINQLIAFGVVLSFCFSALVLALLFAGKKFQILDFISRNILVIIFVLSFVPVLFSLYYSNIIGFEPCILCWYQRIFMYPLIPIFAAAVWKKDRTAVDYGIILSAIGFLIAVYHNIIYYFNIESGTPCAASGVSCIKHFVSELNGFVSIPMMSLAAFTLLLVLLITARAYNKSRVSND